ncbi:hypothetical protein [Helicobacter sp. MIT 05-5294]|uniref:hypothetical protein n=1 Tax=Helicobacter sp. MIT 05-5294 TaxID=1548150 RepID=UPI000A55B441|nr:hypothetical protein [Helicobacter sp. MIT 05-5294]TLD87304.1 hypothetical protein LS69_004610 [Helicobacter sp. MIT 05-5294]
MIDAQCPLSQSSYNDFRFHTTQNPIALKTATTHNASSRKKAKKCKYANLRFYNGILGILSSYFPALIA